MEKQLQQHQRFIKRFFASDIENSDTLFIFHSTGTGKTLSAVLVSEKYINYIKSSGITGHVYIISNKLSRKQFVDHIISEFGNIANDLQKSEIATEYDAARQNKYWTRIAKELGVDFIDATNEADRVKYKAFVLEKLPQYLPQAFFTPGTFAGAGKSGYKRNFFFLSTQELTDLL